MDQIEKYDESHDLQRKQVIHLLDEFSNEISQMHGKCIDIGCGPGLITIQLILPKLPDNATLVGSDLMKSAIKLAETRNTCKQRLSFIQLDIGTKKLPAHLIGKFDNAISTFCIHWCPDPRQAFENIYNLLRPGGKALAIFIAKDNRRNKIYPKLHEYIEYQPYMKDYSNFIPYFHHHISPRASAKKIIEESGFKILHCSDREATFVFKNFDKAAEHFLALNPFMKRMPKDLQQKYEKDIRRELLNTDDIYYTTIQNALNKSTEELQPVMFRYKLLIAYLEKPV